jgi:hypothetical protein
MNIGDNDSPFSEIIYRYTRADALRDGLQVDVTTTAKEAGIRFLVFLTYGVHQSCVVVPKGVTGQDEAGRLWDILWVLRHAMKQAEPGQCQISFDVLVRNDNFGPRLAMLEAVCGPLDLHDPRPAITIMLPGED